MELGKTFATKTQRHEALVVFLRALVSSWQKNNSYHKKN